MMNFR